MNLKNCASLSNYCGSALDLKCFSYPHRTFREMSCDGMIINGRPTSNNDDSRVNSTLSEHTARPNCVIPAAKNYDASMCSST